MSGGTVIGVTGLPCAGKSLAAGFIASGLIPGTPGELIKADDLGHAVLELPEIREELRRRFGAEIFRDPDPVAARRAIADRTFGDSATLEWLERLVHPAVSRAAEAIAAGTDKPGPAVIEAALLLAGDLDRLCDAVVVVEAPFAIRLGRAAGRGWSREELERRERRLAPLFRREILEARGKKIIFVSNDGDEAQLRERLTRQLAVNAVWKSTLGENQPLAEKKDAIWRESSGGWPDSLQKEVH